MKQTAVEWLREQIILNSKLRETKTGKISFKIYLSMLDKVIKQAKEMEKEQIVDFAYVIADDLACGVFREKEDMEKRYEEFLVFRSEEE